MDALLDRIWFQIVDIVAAMVVILNVVFSPLHALGPALAVSIIALLTVAITKLFDRIIPETRRYKELKQKFFQLVALRKEAMKSEDREKGKRLARNIDQAELNQVYYNYFFEGFLRGILVRYIPIFSMLAYVNESYRPERLMALFGKEYIFKFTRSGADPTLIGGVFWFVLSLLLAYVGWFVCAKVIFKRKTRRPSTG